MIERKRNKRNGLEEKKWTRVEEDEGRRKRKRRKRAPL
jgi:hypothetical protein